MFTGSANGAPSGPRTPVGTHVVMVTAKAGEFRHSTAVTLTIR
jgi:hypothetical protein